MSERFSDEVLQRAWEEGYDLFSHELINNFEAPDRTVVVAAMRAVLEGHLAAQIVRLEAHVAMQADVIKDLAGPVEELENLAYERGRQERIRTMCPECGPNVKIDEDGCCTACGHDVTEVTRSCDSCNGTGWLSHRDDHVPCGCVIGQRRAASDGEPQPAALDRVRDGEPEMSEQTKYNPPIVVPPYNSGVSDKCNRCGHPASWHRHDDRNDEPPETAPFRCLGYDCDGPRYVGGTPETRCGCPDMVRAGAASDGSPR